MVAAGSTWAWLGFVFLRMLLWGLLGVLHLLALRTLLGLWVRGACLVLWPLLLLHPRRPPGVRPQPQPQQLSPLRPRHWALGLPGRAASGKCRSAICGRPASQPQLRRSAPPPAVGFVQWMGVGCWLGPLTRGLSS